MTSEDEIPYGKQSVDESDIEAVCGVLRSAWLTTGPLVDTFEEQFADFVGVEHAVAVSSGTAALHAAMFALDIKSGDEVIVPPITFVATANAVVFQGGLPVFVDVEEDTLLLDPKLVAAKITSRTKAIIAVDYAGQPCDYFALREVADKAGLPLVSDGCHSLGASYGVHRSGALADLTAFSFHPVKPITTGEGGMITTHDVAVAARMRSFRNHGIDADHRQRAEKGGWRYQMEVLGYNYRLTDIQCALGLSQLRKLLQWIERRQAIARKYAELLAGSSLLTPLVCRENLTHGYHLYVVRVRNGHRDALINHLWGKSIRANVHYSPVYLNTYYRSRFGFKEGLCPVAETSAEQILSLPIFPTMSDEMIQHTIDAVLEYEALNP